MREENHSKLQWCRQEIEDSFEREDKEFEAAAGEVSGAVRQWWMETKGSIEQHVDEMRTDFESRKAEHEVEKAERAADRAEEEATPGSLSPPTTSTSPSTPSWTRFSHVPTLTRSLSRAEPACEKAGENII